MSLTSVEAILLAQAWQLAALVLAVGAASRLLARNRPHLAHALWLVVLLKCVTPPIWSSPTGVFCWLRSAPAASATALPMSESSLTDSDTVAQTSQSIATTADNESAAGELARNEATSPEHAASAGLPESSSALLSPLRPDGAELADSLPPVERSRRLTCGAGLLAAWMFGSLLVMAVAGLRLLVCLRQLGRGGVRSDAQLDQRLTMLRRQLGVRSRVRLLITDSAVGPAVFGLIRPTILLPTCIAAGRSADELEPLLAHELIHVRRGDLWVGLLQVVAQAVWWFHPLVWLAGRRLSREAERCCDEEVIGSLLCAPARYARSLLDVLELKHHLTAMPAVPGVRPVELTSQRLERIMSLGQGCRRRASWWCWVTMLGVASVVLPGAALVVSGTEAEQPTSDEAAVTAQSGEAARHATVGFVTKRYPMADLLKRLNIDGGSSQSDCQSIALGNLQAALFIGPQRARFLGYDVPAAAQLPNGKRAFDWPPYSCRQPSFSWSDTSLEACDTAVGHQRIVEALAKMRDYDFAHTVEIQITFASGPTELIRDFSQRREMLKAEIADDTDAWEGESPGPSFEQSVHPARSIERQLPVIVDMLDDDATEALLLRLSKRMDRQWVKASVVQERTILMNGGQECFVADSTPCPVIVGVTDGQPQIRVLHNGTALHAKPVLRGNLVELDYELLVQEVFGGDEQTVPTAAGQDPVVVEPPEVARARIRSSVKMLPGKTLLLAGLDHPSNQGTRESVAVFIKVGSPPWQPQTVEAQTSRPMLGEGVNSDAGLVGQILPDAANPAASSLEAASTTDAVPTVAEIRIAGNSTLSAQKITPLLKTCGGKPLDKQLVKEDVERLKKTHHFVSVEPEYETQGDGRVAVIFRVVERPTIRHVRIYGSGKSEKTLAKKAGLKVGDPLDPNAVEEARTKLEEYLHSKAYSHASVAIIEGTKPGDTGVRLMVNERLKQKVWSVGFEGNACVPEDRLQIVMRSKPQVRFETIEGAAPGVDDTRRVVHEGLIENEWALDADGKVIVPDESTDTSIRTIKPILWLFKGEVDYGRINEDSHRLTDYYRGLGFFRARVGHEWVYNEKQDWMTLTFQIDEGPRYVVNSVSVIGNSELESEPLIRNLKLNAGNFFDQSKLTKDVAGVQDKYGEIGYIFAQVQPETRFLEQPGQLDLVLKIEEGQRYRIGRIDVDLAGDRLAERRAAIRAALQLAEGDLANTVKIRLCERRLKASSKFIAAQPGQAPKIVLSAVPDAAADDDDALPRAGESVSIQLAPTPSTGAVDPR